MVSVTDLRSKQRVGVEFLLAEEQSISEIHKGLKNVYGDLAMNRSTNEIKEEEETLQKKKGKVIKFGWVEGVFMRCLLNIWGVMLFLRLSWVVGQAGIGEGVGVIVVANFVTLLTTISMSAVCTNGQIKGGGIYYMISRSLGPEFGGAIGLMFTLANAIAVSMYIVGFCESLQDLLRGYSLTIVDGDINDIRIVGIITLIAILILALVGMDWVTRTQMILLFVLIAAQIDFIAGSIIGPKSAEERSRGFVGYNMETFKENLWNDYRYYEGVHHNFFSVFSVFFPAVTGIVAGANLSGDLKDPSSSIPLGTLLAIVVTFLSYVGYAFMVGACVLRDATGNETMYPMNVFDNASSVDPLSLINYCANSTCKFGLQNDNQVMELVSWWGPLIYGGCFAAALSSAIASLVGAPRVLQALAKDRLYPFIGFFSVGYGANNDPVRGYILVSLISFGCILIAQLNAIAPLLSNFFLAAYALINFSVFHASISKSPGWRPAFKYYNAWVSLLGTLMCIGVMFLMSWVMALITFVVVVTLYLYVSYRKPDVNWGSSTQAQCYNSALKAMLELNHVEEHVKNFRPQLLVLAGMPGTRPPLIDFAALITKGISLLVCGHVLSGRHSQRVHNALSRKAYLWLRKHKIKAFFDVVDSDNFETGTETLMRTSGLGKLRPNTVLMGYKADWQHCDHDELRNYFNIIHNALDRYLAVGILRLDGGLDYSRVLQDDEFVPISKLDKKDEEEKLRRNQSACQLTQVARDLADLEQTDESSDCDCGPGDAVSADPDPDRDADPGALSSVAADDSPAASASPAGRAANGVSRRMRRWGSQLFLGPTGEPLSPELLARLTRFRQKQPKGYIDVWWLYDDGGLTLLIPYILSTRSQFSGCKLRIFSLASSKNELDREQRNLAALLSKFRIDYSDVVVIPNITQQAQEKTRLEFESLIEKFRINSSNGENSSNACFPIRYAVAVLGFLGIAFQYMLKVTLSVAIVGMVSKPDKDEDAVLDDTCPVTVTNTSSSSQTGEFDWDEEMQGHILSSYYYGYVAMQIVGGHSAAKFGGRWVYGAGLFAAGLLTLLGPLAAYAGPVVFMVSRIGVGLASGVIIPAMHVMFTKWFPDHERQRLSGAIFSANYMGTLLSMAVSGTMVKNLGWPSVFYVFGGISTVTIIPWVYFVYSEPESHPRITEKELRYILENTGCSMKEKSSKEPADSQDNSNRTNPWIMIPLTPGMWAHCLVLFAVGWVNYTLLSELPTYMQNILHFDIDEAGFISALPYLFGWMSCSIYSFLTQWFIQKGMRKIVAFKIWDAIACIGPALCLLGVTLLGCDVTGIVAMFVLTMVTRCAIYGGSYLNHIDMFPHAAGTAAGIAQTFITVPGIITPLVTSAFISGQQNIQQWSKVLYVVMGVSAIPYLAYLLFGTVEEQETRWMNKRKEKDVPKV